MVSVRDQVLVVKGRPEEEADLKKEALSNVIERASGSHLSFLPRDGPVQKYLVGAKL